MTVKQEKVSNYIYLATLETRILTDNILRAIKNDRTFINNNRECLESNIITMESQIHNMLIALKELKEYEKREPLKFKAFPEL